MPQQPSPARKAAVDLLDQVLDEGRPLSENVAVLEKLGPSDRAAAQRLAADVLRNMERADRLLQHHLRKKPTTRVMNILRLGTYELCTGGAAHGVVSDCVNVAAVGHHTQGAKGLVNAVLRKIAAKGPDSWGDLRVPRMPKWLRGPLLEAWGAEIVPAMETAHFNGAPLDLTAKGDPAALAEVIGGVLLPTGSVRLADAGQVTALPGFEDGDWWVQDAAAALPAKLLGDVAGKQVLDLCAAPGGKTLQLAAAGAEVTALDLSAKRLGRVRDNLRRARLEAALVEGDALEHEGLYDAILLDAPCSATGTIRRHPDLPHAHEGERIADLIGLQAALLDHALDMLKPDGRLVFATCSLIPDEGECQVEEVLERRDDVAIVAPDIPGLEESWRSEEGGLRLRPDFWADKGGMDGFYMAILQKT
ncbi:RsmB/NOP family class I SAM-dependent RNA methyltransferase [Pelagimonas varians]|uniref:Ribosomal RNA small subunit methyltransferase B n=1 Tax=Pelagimonas varians TaxID=696760 RepID=A0A238K3H5_9RHOB|nr:transcription antitermination factor NusB [Pelagimonas varians]PYG30498.1 16S rRNA (cytosine967-C5)-methyltransferase [Pelagimonas varians]SMX37440.1 Ribosomal RNA small subunit methyltransferase B [Pelagimonas varians]